MPEERRSYPYIPDWSYESVKRYLMCNPPWCGECKIPMVVAKEWSDMIDFECPNCGKKLRAKIYSSYKSIEWYRI